VTDPLETFRAELGGWIAEHDAELAPFRELRTGDVATRLESGRRLLQLLHGAGWARRGWPSEFGGLGGDARERGVLYDELGTASLPVPEQLYVLETVGPAVAHFAPDLAAKYLPGYLRGAEFWCQGFSEPEAGSDLASLRCRARPVDGGFLVSGQKIWSSYGHLADRIVLLARTGEPGSRHRGLTMLLVDLDSPGITRRPIRLANDEEELSEIFFDDVHVSTERLIGDVDGGWAVAMFLLQFERGMYAWMRQVHLRGLLTALARSTDPEDPVACAALARAHVAHRALRVRCWTTLGRLADRETPGPEISVDKVLLATAEQTVLDTARRLDPVRFHLGDDPGSTRLRSEWFYTRAASIYGGSAEVQRSILADHVLRLPKEAKA
jgi:alkylation response protein AidB-like acyl-CoA dehydrogenase